MRLLREWRWYSWMAVGLWGLTGAALIAALTRPLLQSFAVLLGRSARLPDLPVRMLALAAGVSLVTLCWQHYVVPLLACRDVRLTDARTPRIMLRNYWLSLWMPFIIAAILCVTNFVPVYLGLHPLDRWLRLQPWIVYLIAAMPVLILPPLALMRPLRARLMRNARQQGRCLECGYHLLGVWSSECPECGTTRFDIGAEAQS